MRIDWFDLKAQCLYKCDYDTSQQKRLRPINAEKPSSLGTLAVADYY